MAPAFELQPIFEAIRDQRLDQAQRELERFASSNAPTRDFWLACGMLHVARGNYAQAMEALEQELQLYSDNEVARQFRANLIKSGIAHSRQPKWGQSALNRRADASNQRLAFQLQAALSSVEVRERALRVMSQLEPDYWLGHDLERYRYGIEHKSFWFEQPGAVHWFARALQPQNYLEVGVRRGRTMAQVVSESPQTKIYGFDMWIPNYGSNEAAGIVATNPGPEFVLRELAKINPNCVPQFFVGNSHLTLPRFFSDPTSPQQFELMVIDGDHTYEGAKLDLDLAFAHLAPGGVLVFDDIYHHAHRELLDLWRTYQATYPDYLFIEDHFSTGTGIAIKPPFDKLEATLAGSIASRGRRLRALMPYSVDRELGKITLPEWLKEGFRAYYSSEVEVFACGPANEIDLPDGPDFYEQVARLCEELKIDFVFDVEGGAESLDFMFRRYPTSVRVPKIFWAIDTHQYLEEQQKKARHFDWTYSAQKNAVAAFGEHSEWLPAGASLHEEDFGRERDILVGFVGSISAAHSKRAHIVKFLQERLAGFEVFNNVFLSDKSELVSRMKIAVNVSLNNDVNFRVFETLACGALLMTDRLEANGLEEMFQDGVHLVIYNDDQDLLNKIHYYLEHEEERARIAKAGKALVDGKYRHFHQLGKVLERAKSLLARQESITAQTRERACFCGGELKDTVHPLYASCRECGTQVLRKQYSPEELKQFYTADGYWHERQVAVFNFPPIEERAERDFQDRIPVWHKVLAEHMPRPKHLLEIGCAHGGFLHYCRERGAENVVGVEVDEATCAFARQRFGLPHVASGLFPQTELPFSKFEAITGFDVIEHFIDPIEGLQAVANLLADEGICFFQTPWYRGEGANWTQYKPAEHTFLFTEEGVRTLFKRVGLEVVSIQQGYFPDDMFVVGRKAERTRTVLFVRTDSIGDNLLSLPLLEPIKHRFGGARVVVACQDRAVPIYHNNPAVDQIIPFNRQQLSEDEAYRESIVTQLRALHADVVINAVYSRELLTDYLAVEAQGKVSYAFHGDLNNIESEMRDEHNEYYSFLIESNNENASELVRNLELAAALGIERELSSPKLQLTPGEIAWAKEYLRVNGIDPKHLVILAPTAQYSIKNYARLGAALEMALTEVRNGGDWKLVALGAPGEEILQSEILRPIAGRYLDLCGKLTLRQSAALIAQARFVISVDTALAHIACALGVPNLVLMGGGHFGRFFPYSTTTMVVAAPLECYGCNWQCCFSSSRCLDNLPPQVVAEAISQLADETSKGFVSARPRLLAISSPEGAISLRDWAEERGIEYTNLGLAPTRVSGRVFPAESRIS